MTSLWATQYRAHFSQSDYRDRHVNNSPFFPDLRILCCASRASIGVRPSSSDSNYLKRNMKEFPAVRRFNWNEAPSVLYGSWRQPDVEIIKNFYCGQCNNALWPVSIRAKFGLVLTHMVLPCSVDMNKDTCVIETNKAHFSFLTYSDNLTSACFE